MIALSFLGTGKYSETTYQLEEKSCKTNLMPFAVKQFFQPQTLFVAQTKEAKDMHGKALEAVCTYTAIEIPSGKTNDELWQMFSLIADAIPENAHLVVDITHGFRSQPIIALAIVQYLQAAKNVKVEKIIYGAFEAKEGDVTPVFDLTPFLVMMNWASATEHLLKFGDAQMIKLLLTEAQRENRISGLKTEQLKNLGDDLAKLTNSLATVRPQESIKIAKSLSERLKAVQHDLVAPNAQPLKPLIAKMESRFAKIAVRESLLFTQKGFEAQAEMIDFYLKTENYSQAITLAREAVVSKVCIKKEADPIKNRSVAETLLNKLAEDVRNKLKLSKEEEQIARIWNDITNSRNDINHAGMRDEPLSSESLIKNIQSACEKAIEFLKKPVEKIAI